MAGTLGDRRGSRERPTLAPAARGGNGAATCAGHSMPGADLPTIQADGRSHSETGRTDERGSDADGRRDSQPGIRSADEPDPRALAHVTVLLDRCDDRRD